MSPSPSLTVDVDADLQSAIFQLAKGTPMIIIFHAWRHRGMAESLAARNKAASAYFHLMSIKSTPLQ